MNMARNQTPVDSVQAVSFVSRGKTMDDPARAPEIISGALLLWLEAENETLYCPQCGAEVNDFSWNDYDWYPNLDGKSGEKVGSRHRHGCCKCGHRFCELGNSDIKEI